MDEEESDIIGARCSLIEPYKEYNDGMIIADYGLQIVIRINISPIIFFILSNIFISLSFKSLFNISAFNLVHILNLTDAWNCLLKFRKRMYFKIDITIHYWPPPIFLDTAKSRYPIQNPYSNTDLYDLPVYHFLGVVLLCPYAGSEIR